MLKRVKLSGFMSIREMDLELGPLNVLIGANGSGKSNLISFFRMLRAACDEGLQRFTGLRGGGDALLHYGASQTPSMVACLEWDNDMGYDIELEAAAPDTLVYAREWPWGLGQLVFPEEQPSLGAGHRESLLRASARRASHEAAVAVHAAVTAWRYHHVQDTSENAKIRKYQYVDNNRQLASDGANLAAYMLMLRETNYECYRRIVGAVAQVAPFLHDFEVTPLRPNPRQTALRWQGKHGEALFGPHQLSDGTLRFTALMTLLLQPEDMLPPLIAIDEPELGLHPYALDTLADVLRSLPKDIQVLVATQSADLVDRFEPEQVIVVDLDDGASEFGRLDADSLSRWLARYQNRLSELWKKGIIGGAPAA